MRGAMIAIGAQLVAQFSWILYLFGGILILTAIKMAFFTGEDMDPAQNFIIRRVRRMFPVTHTYHGEHFFIRGAQGLMLTPLALALVMVETTDLIFAVDSIPAIFAVTDETFLVFTSNAFAILGLRALYFLLAGMLGRFRYLRFGLAAVLVFVGGKMLLADVWKTPIWASLTVIVLTIGVSVLVSWLRPEPEGAEPAVRSSA
jgi:tellurite resistance protein TerC